MRWFYRCPSCGAEYPIEPGRYLCGPCAERRREAAPLEGVLECAWEGEPAAGDCLDERYAIPLPVEPRFFPPIPVGDTPLWEPARLRAETGFPRLYVKDDTCEPTGSFKDRASYLVAAFARKHGIGEIALASTGNAASSMSGIGAAAGLRITVFLPAAAPVAKRIQVLQYGANLHQVDGTYDVAFEESLAYSEKTGTLSRNTAYNPLTIEGKKTVAFEIAKQLGESQARAGSAQPGAWNAPDEVFVPTGDGVIIAGVYKGFEDLMRLGRISRMPRVWACQARGSSAIARALEAGYFGAPVPSETIADSISVDVPRNGAYALEKLRKHGGRAVAVSDADILAAQRTLASRAGLFAEPSSSTALAGFLAVRAELDPKASVVLLVTGSGLKDIKSAMRGLGLE
jgi:threonine synthase